MAVTQQIEFNGTIGRILAAVLVRLAGIEWECRKEGQAAGIEIARQKGVFKGRGPGTAKKNPQRAIQLRDKGLTVPEIAKDLASVDVP